MNPQPMPSHDRRAPPWHAHARRPCHRPCPRACWTEVLHALAPRDGGSLPRRHVRRRRLCRRHPAIRRLHAVGDRPRPRRHRARRQPGRALSRPPAPASRPVRRHGRAARAGRRAPRWTAWCWTSASPPSRSTSPARGFSFRTDGPLDMRMGKHGTTRRRSGEHAAGTRAGRRAVRIRRGTRLPPHRPAPSSPPAPRRRSTPPAAWPRSSARVLPPDRSGIDPATRSFQALRIRVNDELGEIERALASRGDAAGARRPAGRRRVPSLEDRIVKRFMTDAAGRAPSPSRHDPRGLLTRARARNSAC